MPPPLSGPCLKNVNYYPELKLILVKTSLDLAGNIKYSPPKYYLADRVSRQYSCLCQAVHASDEEWWRVLSPMSGMPEDSATENWEPSIWPDTRVKGVRQTLSSGQMQTVWQSEVPQYQIVFRYRVTVSGYNAMSKSPAWPASSQLPAVSVRNCESWLQIELLISVHITYYILQPPPLYCHRYWTHAWTNMWPLWPFSRGFMSVLYISWCNCELNCLCNSFLIK